MEKEKEKMMIELYHEHNWINSRAESMIEEEEEVNGRCRRDRDREDG